MNEETLHALFCTALNSLVEEGTLTKEQVLFGVSDDQDDRLFKLRDEFDKFLVNTLY